MNRREFLKGTIGTAGFLALGTISVGSLASEGDPVNNFHEVSFLLEDFEGILSQPQLRTIYTSRAAIAFRERCKELDTKVYSLTTTIMHNYQPYNATLVCVLAGLDASSKPNYEVVWDPDKKQAVYCPSSGLPTEHELLIRNEVKDRLVREGYWA